jgi:AraC-like DNA-binding protein
MVNYRPKPIKEAKKMLADPELADLSVTDIAFEVGYEAVQTFDDHFRNATGMCPTEYRAFHMHFKLLTDMDPSEYSKKESNASSRTGSGG